MKLLTSLTSPFGRKARVVVIERGCDDVEIVPANSMAADGPVSGLNPLGKVPVLVLEGGETLYDSPVICEFLDQHAGSPALLPPEGMARVRALRDQALADGLLDAAVATVFETRRPEAQQSPLWLERWRDAVARSLDVMEAAASGKDESLDLGGVAWGCALGYLDFRLDALGWREGRPALTAWAERTLARESFRATAPEE
jgi:glutathione S-transferase